MYSMPLVLIMLTRIHSPKNVALSIKAAGETFRTVNDGSLGISVKQGHEWRSTLKKIPPLVVLEFKKQSERSMDRRAERAVDAQIAGEMLAVVQMRVEVFGGGQFSELTAEQRIVRL